jgi:hypothetical protein
MKEIYSLLVLKVRSLTWFGNTACPLEAPGENPVLPFLASKDCLHPNTPLPGHHFSLCTPLSPPPASSMWSQGNQPGQFLHLEVFNLVIPAKSLLHIRWCSTGFEADGCSGSSITLGCGHLWRVTVLPTTLSILERKINLEFCLFFYSWHFGFPSCICHGRLMAK